MNTGALSTFFHHLQADGHLSFVKNNTNSGCWSKNHIFVNRMSTLFTLLTVEWIRVKKIYLADPDEKGINWTWKEVGKVFKISPITEIHHDIPLVFETVDGDVIAGEDMEETTDGFERDMIFGLAAKKITSQTWLLK